MAVYGYCRVSTKNQFLDGNSLESQRSKILSIYDNAQIIQEQFTGGTVDRPGFTKLIDNDLKDNDILVVSTLDRFARTVVSGLHTINVLLDRGVKIHILNMGLIEDTPLGKLIITNLLAFAEFEKAQILERTSNGRMVARQTPEYKEGRPRKYSTKQLDLVVELLKTKSYTEVSEITGISKSTITREVRKRKFNRIS